ncbi:MAG: hypothetical protein ACR2HC_08420 [Thermoleophilaceae bacterium]
MPKPMDAERKQRLDRFQAWAFVGGAVLALLTFPVVGILFGLGAVAVSYRNDIPRVREAGLAIAALCIVVLVFGIGSGEGGGLLY